MGFKQVFTEINKTFDRLLIDENIFYSLFSVNLFHTTWTNTKWKHFIKKVKFDQKNNNLVLKEI